MPATQGEHCEAPPREKEPGSQPTQAIAPGALANIPEAQGTQADWPALEYLPGWHMVHVVVPSVLGLYTANLPASQVVQPPWAVVCA